MSEAGSIAGIDDWQKIAPDRNHDWIGQREPGFDQLCPLGSKAAKKGMAGETIFNLFSNGYKTGRDAWLYNFSRNSCLENARLMIEDYQAAVAELGERPSPAQAKAAAARHKANVHWDDTLLSNLKQRKHVKFTPGKIRKIPYRPFVKQNCYVDDKLVQRSAVRRQFFPDADAGNRAICVPGVGSTKPFSALMVDAMPDIQFMFNGQCFPRYRFERQPQLGGLLAEEPQESGWADNISDAALERFRMHCGDPEIAKDGIFDYVYGALHAPGFRAAFPNALSKELARIPLAGDFRALAEAGRELGELHLGYETCPEYPLDLEFSGDGEPRPEHFRLGGRPMRYAGGKGGGGRSVLIVNEHIQLAGIPDEAHSYAVNGRTPLEWLIDRYKVSTDKKSGIVNDANAWFEHPEDLVAAIRRIVHLSVETARIIGRIEAIGAERLDKT